MQDIKIKNPESSLKTSFKYLVVLFGAIVLYTATCAPGPLWQDSGHFQYRIYHNDIEGSLGLALSHPLYMLIGITIKHIPFGDLAFKINHISVIAGAITIANIFLFIILWSGKLLPAVIATLTLALSHTLWFHCTITETYTLYTALFSAELLMLLQYSTSKKIKFLYWLTLFNGLATATHIWAIIPLSCYIIVLLILLKKKQIPLQHLFGFILLWCIGASSYLFLVFKNIINTGDILPTLSSALFGNTWQSSVLNLKIGSRLIKENLILISYNFPTPNIILFFVGLFSLKKIQHLRSLLYILLVMLLLFFVFAFRYTVPDRYAFFIPFYLLVSIFIGLGAHILLAKIKTSALNIIILILTVLPVPAYIIAPKIAEKLKFNLNTKRQIPFRNDYEWFLTPWKTNCYGPLK
ncbi:MAG: protein O-mannosyl-transferase family, partial [Planctomycetota bacterium]